MARPDGVTSGQSIADPYHNRDEAGVVYTVATATTGQRVTVPDKGGSLHSVLNALYVETTSADRDDKKDQRESMASDSGSRVLALSAASLFAQIQDYKGDIRGNNKLAVEVPEFRDGLLDFLDRLSSDLQGLILVIPDSKSFTESIEVQGWRERYWKDLCEEFTKYIAPESVSKATIPSGIILAFSAIGAIIGGPLGFGAGGVVGKLFIGTAKPDELSKKVEDALSSKDDQN